MSEEKQLIILPFDHRGSFMERMFGITGEPTSEEAEKISAFKNIIYNGFRLAVNTGKIPVESAGILVDEQFGDVIIRDAKERGYITCICAEKSGKEEFDFEFDGDFREHITKYNPDFVKVLIRYNPEGDQELNEKQALKMKNLSDFCSENGYKLMIEPLVIATEKQMEIVDGDLEVYDKELRPRLMELMIEELHGYGVEPAIWKIEGLEKEQDYKNLVDIIKSEGRVSDIIVLGRHADDDQVKSWIAAGGKVDGVVGFAVGRTIFWDPLIRYKEKEISEEEAADIISERFLEFYDFFVKVKTGLV